MISYISPLLEIVINFTESVCPLKYNGKRWKMEKNKRLLIKALLNIPLLYFSASNHTARAVIKNSLSSSDCIYPEDFGAKGNGIDDDSSAINLCFLHASRTNKYVCFKKSSQYLWQKKITIIGTIRVLASGATIISDSNFLEVIDGPDSIWTGGYLKTNTMPYTVVYSNDWEIKEKGFLGYGRMPFDNESSRLESEYINQLIGSALVFKSSNNKPVNGVVIKDVKTNYGNIIIAGYDNIVIDSCSIKGGAHMGGVSIFNGTRDPLLWGYKNRINPYEFSKGSGHKISNCKFYQCRNNGLFISGSDSVTIENCEFIDNGESGLKTGQYVKRSWTNTNCCCSNFRIINCFASGQGYDGFDLQNAFGSGEFVHIPANILISDCRSINNRRTGFISQGGNNFFIDCSASNNGSHGIVSKYSRNVRMLRCKAINNAQLFNAIELGLLGPDCIMEKCSVIHNKGNGKYFLIKHLVDDESIKRKSGYSIKNKVSDFKKCDIDRRVIIIS